MKFFVLSVLGLSTAAPAAAQFPTEPPQAAPVAPYPLAAPKEVLLPNGLRLIVVEQPRQPVVSISLSMPGGTAFDPKDKEGTADLLGRLLTRGAGARTSAEMSAAIESVGGSLGALTDPDALTIQADLLAAHAGLALDMMADMIQRPTIDSLDLERAKGVVLGTLTTEPDDGGALASRVFLVGAYRQLPYARRPTPASIVRISRADLNTFRAARLRPTGSVLVIAGAITLAEAQRLATRSLGSWKGPRPAGLPLLTPTPAPPIIYLIHRGGAQTADIVVGNTTFSGTDTTWYAATVLNRILGEGRESRLVRDLMGQHNWALTAGSAFQRTARLGLFQATAEVEASVADSTVRQIQAAMATLRTDLVPAKELDRAKESISGEFPLKLQTMSQLAAALGQARMYGLSATYLPTYRSRITRVTAATVRAVARKVFDPAQTTIVVAGDGAKLYKQLSALGTVKMFAPNGRPLTEKDVQPSAGALKLDIAQLTPRLDSMVIVAQGQAIGMQVSQIERGGDSVVYTEKTTLGPQLNQTTALVFDSAGRMRRLDQTGKVRGQDTKIALSYSGNRVKGQAQVLDSVGRPRTLAVDTALVAGAIDDNGLVALLPALPLALNTRWVLPLFGSGENRVRNVTVTVADIEQVRTPAGDFEAFRVDLEGAAQAVSFYLTTKAPFRLVRISLTGSPVEFLAVNKR